MLGEGRDEDDIKCSWRDKQGQSMKNMKVLFRDQVQPRGSFTHKSKKRTPALTSVSSVSTRIHSCFTE